MRPKKWSQPLPVHILILAAGASSRMRGKDKLLERIDGIAQIRRAVLAAQATGARTHVVLDPRQAARRAVLEGLDYHPVDVTNADEGMAASLRAGIAALPPGAVLVHLADLPEVTAGDLAQMIAAHDETPDLILRATAADGRPGHPVLFPDWARPALLRLQGDQGARAMIRDKAIRLRTIPLPGEHAITDLDTPEDWAAWRAARKDPAIAPHGQGDKTALKPKT
ncbi:MAG: NTP transferase domain-containing protein [Pseudorhodobacter sp.]